MQMQRAKAKSFLHHTRMGQLATLWDLHIILILPLFLLMSLSVQPHSVILKNQCKLGQVLWLTLLLLVVQDGRNIPDMMPEKHQNPIQETIERNIRMLVFEEREVWLKPEFIRCEHNCELLDASFQSLFHGSLLADELNLSAPASSCSVIVSLEVQG